MWSPRSHALMCSSLILLLLAVEGKGPYLIIGNSRPKCVTVVAPRATTLLVEYDVPDMVEVTEDGPVFDKKKKTKEDAVGLDAQYEKRFMQKFEAMKRAGRTMRDISIVVLQKGETVRDVRQKTKADEVLDRKSSGRLRLELEKKEGVIEYTTGSRDGPVEVCVQSLMATPQRPSRMSLYVKEKEDEQKKKESSKDTSSLDESQRKAQQHVSRMERDLVGLSKKVEIILSNADFAKEQEVKFHDQSLAMNKASQWWPMLHVAFLFITGFTQANHIVRFFKQRHIF